MELEISKNNLLPIMKKSFWPVFHLSLAEREEQLLLKEKMVVLEYILKVPQMFFTVKILLNLLATLNK